MVGECSLVINFVQCVTRWFCITVYMSTFFDLIAQCDGLLFITIYRAVRIESFDLHFPYKYNFAACHEEVPPFFH